MENRLKERLVGATVLVVLAVIFVPMVLDGPGSGRVERRVELPPQNNGAEAERRTVRLDLTRPGAEGQANEPDADVPATEAVASNDSVEIDLTTETAATETKPAAPERTEEKPPVRIAARQEPALAKPAEPEGEWTVQVGSFGKQANADAQVARLKELGFNAYVSRYSDGRHTLYRVRSGGFESREAAAAEAAKIKSKSGQNARPALND